MKSYPTGPTTVGYVAGKMITEAILKAGTAEDVDKVVQAMSTVSFEGPTGKTTVRACDNMALYNFMWAPLSAIRRCPTVLAWAT